jgi:hypothetical protein
MAVVRRGTKNENYKPKPKKDIDDFCKASNLSNILWRNYKDRVKDEQSFHGGVIAAYKYLVLGERE